MKKILLGLLIFGSISAFAEKIKIFTHGYGANDSLACNESQNQAYKKLEAKCKNGNLTDVTFGVCQLVSQGDYYVVYSVDAEADCI